MARYDNYTKAEVKTIAKAALKNSQVHKSYRARKFLKEFFTKYERYVDNETRAALTNKNVAV